LFTLKGKDVFTPDIYFLHLSPSLLQISSAVPFASFRDVTLSSAHGRWWVLAKVVGKVITSL